MKLSRNFLSDYIDTKEYSDYDLAEAMTMIGNEYESIDKLSSATKIVIGYVREIKDHPDSDHLHVCQVEIAPNEVVQIVCGAPNVDKGQKVLVSLPGAILPGDIEIKKGVIRGEESNGMICSLSELGIESKYQSEEDKSGIHVLDKDAPIGEDAIKYLGFDDTTIDFELTANRGDLLSVIGMAYEIGAINGKHVKLPETKPKKEVDDIKNYVKIEIKTDKCPLYLARCVKDLKIAESPNWLKSRLMASGVRPINNVVDISNYVMLEYGQPLHFFDHRTLGNKIIVRQAEDNEKIVTLDKEERTLTSEDIVIANEEGPVCLAGVMGGLNSEVEEDTTEIIIESAIFNATNIRRTANKILRSEASSRFEKGIDPHRTYMAIERACYLLEKYASGTVIKGIEKYDTNKYQDNVITITLDDVNSLLGIKFTKKEVVDTFKRLSFEVKEEKDKFIVTVPSHRLDIHIKEDLIEEIGRIQGITKLPSTLPITENTPGRYEDKYYFNKLIRNRLVSLGLYQVRSYTLTDIDSINRYSNEEKEYITLASPLSEDKKYLRTSLIPSLLSVANYNLARKNNDIMIFEDSNIYYLENNETKEKALVSGLVGGVYDNNEWQHEKIVIDFYTAKGIVENLLDYLGLTNRYHFDTIDIPSDFHPYQAARITVDRNPVGYVGRIHPNNSKNKLYAFELDLDKLMAIKVRTIKNREIPKYPAIQKDFAFVLDKDISSDEVIKTINKACGRLLVDIDIFDYYEGENIDTDKKSLAFKLTFQDSSKTLSDEEVMVLFNKAIDEVIKKHNAILRDK